MTSNLLTKADREYKDLTERRRGLLEKRPKLLAEAQRVQASRPTEGQIEEVTRPLREADEEIGTLARQIEPAKRRARATASAQIRGSGDYRRAVQAAALGLGEVVGPFIGLESIWREAAAEQVFLPALPPSIATLLAEARAWTAAMVADGALDAADLPPALRKLAGEA